MRPPSDRQLTTQGAERKQQLLDAAARLFAEQGYAATRVVDIVDAAGVAKGLFYWYFENKEALFRELAADMLALSVVGTVGQFGHFHRTHRVELSLDDLSGYVARMVARMLAADEHTARSALAALGSREGAPAATV